ncbi:unnamed protein product [Auanema sp. JU1783]|nr:unnamed protein product [Auanema sp. JU1783]
MGGCVSGPFTNIKVAKLSFTNKGIIKQGGFGTVYRVREKETNEELAVKIITTKNDESLAKKAKYEISILRKFRNLKEIVHLMSADFDDYGNYYLVFPYFPRGSLADLLADFRKYDLRLTKERIVFFLSHILNGLIWIHTMGYIHRDLKPANFVFNDRDELVIIDLGSVMRKNIIIGNNNERNRLVDECNEMCSILYRPPELFSCDLGSFITDKVDIWMLGCCLYEMIYTRNPMEAVHASGNSVALAALSPERFPYPNDHCVDDEILNLAKKMMQADPARRISLRRVREAVAAMQETEEEEEEEVEHVETEQGTSTCIQQSHFAEALAMGRLDMHLEGAPDLDENHLRTVPEQDEPSESSDEPPTRQDSRAEDEQSVENLTNYVAGSEPPDSDRSDPDKVEQEDSQISTVESEVVEAEVAPVEVRSSRGPPPPITPRGPIPFNPMRFLIKRAADNCREKYRRKFRRAGRMSAVHEESEDAAKSTSSMFTFHDAASSGDSSTPLVRKDLEHSYLPPRAALVSGQRYPERGQLLSKFAHHKNPQVIFTSRFIENYLYFKRNGFSIPDASVPTSILIEEEKAAHERKMAILMKAKEKAEEKKKEKAQKAQERKEMLERQAEEDPDRTPPATPVVECKEPRPSPFHYMPFDPTSDTFISVEDQIDFIKEYHDEELKVIQQPNLPPPRTFLELLRRFRTGQKRFSEPYLLIDPPPVMRPDPIVDLLEEIQDVPERPDSPYSVWRQCKVFDRTFTKKLAKSALRKEPFLPKHYPIDRERMKLPPVPSPVPSITESRKKKKKRPAQTQQEDFSQLTSVPSRFDTNQPASKTVDIPMQTFSRPKEPSSHIMTEVVVEPIPNVPCTCETEVMETEIMSQEPAYVINELGISMPTNLKAFENDSPETARIKAKGELIFVPALHLPDTLPALCDDSSESDESEFSPSQESQRKLL